MNEYALNGTLYGEITESYTSGRRGSDVGVLDCATGAGTSDVDLIASTEVDKTSVATGDDVVPAVEVYGLRLAKVTVHSNCASYNKCALKSTWSCRSDKLYSKKCQINKKILASCNVLC